MSDSLLAFHWDTASVATNRSAPPMPSRINPATLSIHKRLRPVLCADCATQLLLLVGLSGRFEQRSFAFFDAQNAIDPDARKAFDLVVGPAHLYAIQPLRGAQTEMQHRGAAGQVARCGRYLADPDRLAGMQGDSRAIRKTVRRRAAKPQFQPMADRRAHVMQQQRHALIIDDQNIDTPVVIEVSGRQATPEDRPGKRLSRHFTDALETLAFPVVKEQRRL